MSKVKTIVGLFDAHIDKDGFTKEYNIAKNYIASEEPDEVIIGGDYGDFGCISHWNEDKLYSSRDTDFEKDLEVLNGELDFLQRYSKKVTYLVGNHEDWLIQFVEKHPQFYSNINLDKCLNLTKRGITIVPLNHLYKTGSLHWTHGMYVNEHHAKKHFQKLGCSVIYGHVHNYQTYSANMKMQEPFVSMSIGCLCNHEPAYLKGKPANWINQIATVYVNKKTDNFNIYPMSIIDDEIMYVGRIIK